MTPALTAFLAALPARKCETRDCPAPPQMPKPGWLDQVGDKDLEAAVYECVLCGWKRSVAVVTPRLA